MQQLTNAEEQLMEQLGNWRKHEDLFQAKPRRLPLY
jgi:hypothetical protein